MDEKRKVLMGKRIREERLKTGMSQDLLAEKLGMKRANVSNYEAGRTIPPSNVLLDMSLIFEVTTDYLLCKTDEPNENDTIPFKKWFRQDNQDLTREEQDEFFDELEDYMEYRKQRILDKRR